MFKRKVNKKIISLTLILIMLMGINAYGVSGVLTPQKNGLLSTWNIGLSELYLSNNMYLYEATETQVDYRKFDVVSLTIVAFGIVEDEKNIIQESGVYTLTGNVVITPGCNPVGTGACSYYVEDPLYGYDEEMLVHN